MAEWLEWADAQLIGPQSGGYSVWGDLRWPDQPYGVVLRSGLTPAGVADLLTAERVDGLYVRTSGGARLDEPSVEIAPLAEPDTRPGGHGTRILLARASGAPAGAVPVTARVRTPADLCSWLRRLSPLLPGGTGAADWPVGTLAAPLAATFHHRRDDILLVLQPLEQAEQFGANASAQLLVRCSRADVARHAAALGSRAVLEARPTANMHELHRWLGELCEAWGSAPLPGMGMWAGASPLPGGTRASVHRIEEGAAELVLCRKGRSELTVRGPLADVAHWAGPLLDPGLHDQVAATSRRRVAGWLKRTEQAVFGTSAAWTVEQAQDPLPSAELAAWLSSHHSDCRIAVSGVADGAVTLIGTRSTPGAVAVTGRRATAPQ
ncbi:hypothetical protein [Peterkaempfera sp. SMS 1(5)a]|uniref:hypothetical protein n=1 Tax=Peterkaempfera podocarpi TaxID=3232308 RepID=UPI003672A741